MLPQEASCHKKEKTMNMIELTTQQILMLLPLLALQLGLALFCAFKIFREGVANLNKWIWLGICLFINLLGPVIFLMIGRKREMA